MLEDSRQDLRLCFKGGGREAQGWGRETQGGGILVAV